MESFLDISSIKAIEKELRKLSVTDELTGIATGASSCTPSPTRQARLAIWPCHMSVEYRHDDFKKVNDGYGHYAGDMVLRKLAQLAGQELRDSDLFARVGGDEFSIILLETDQQAALEVADRLRRRVEGHCFLVEGNEIACTISLGVTAFNAKEDDLKSWLNRADRAFIALRKRDATR